MKIDSVFPVLAIHGVPRSGTSWLGEIFNSHEQIAYRYQPFFSYAFKGKVAADSSGAAVEAFFRQLLETQDDFVLQRGEARLATSEWQFRKEAPKVLAYKEVRYHYLLRNLFRQCENLVGIGLIRNPCGVINSWQHAPREFDASWSLLEEWRYAARKNSGSPENYFGYEKWKEVAYLFESLADEFGARFRILTYEDLVRDPLNAVAPVLSAFDLSPTRQMKEFVRLSQSRNDCDPYGVCREDGIAVAHRWRWELDGNIQRAIYDDLGKDVLGKYLK